MKLTRTLLAIIAMAGALSLTPAMHAQTNAAPPRQGGGGGQRRSVDEQVTALTELLKLTDEQKPKVKTILEEQGKKRQEITADTGLSQEDARAKRTALREDTNKKMKEVLTPEQFKQWEVYLQQQRGRRNGGGGGGGNN